MPKFRRTFVVLFVPHFDAHFVPKFRRTFSLPHFGAHFLPNLMLIYRLIYSLILVLIFCLISARLASAGGCCVAAELLLLLSCWFLRLIDIIDIALNTHIRK